MEADAVAALPATPLPGGAADPASPLAAAGEAAAYVMFTSGSTGRPKGVVIPHRGVLRLARDTDHADLGPQTTWLQLATTSFDASTLELWNPLLNGGRLAVPPPGEYTVEQLEGWIADLRRQPPVPHRRPLPARRRRAAGGAGAADATVQRRRRDVAGARRPAARGAAGPRPGQPLRADGEHRGHHRPPGGGGRRRGGGRSVPIGRALAGSSRLPARPPLRAGAGRASTASW